MSPDRWKQIEEVFQAALDVPPDERAAYVERACAGDPGLREQVIALVKQFDRAGSLEDSQARSFEESQFFAPPPPPAEEADPMEGRRVGAYRLVREIGRGGMGAVYLAERADSEFKRQVAVKLVKRGMDTDFILRRFRNERQILASLNHPNIARLLDGGTTDDGLPYFVMEYIQGRPLYQYCDEQRLDLRARLQLFSHVCAAVSYAHQNLVIHRDIKPSNILVTAAGVPKLLDFGIAKLLNPELAADTSPMTATAMRLMTPEYASPEQVQGLTVTPASDIYSLGVLLYELLTGHRPYRLRHRSPHEVARVICEDEPERPSAVVASTDEMLTVGDRDPTLEAISAARAASPEKLRRELAGGLDQIVMKAMRKEPQRRYRTAEEVRDDITRYLEGRPVNAPAYFPTPRPPKAAPESRDTGEKTLAVLPLKLLSPADDDTGEAFLGVGLADALITRLSNVRRLAVRPTSAVLRYGDWSGDPLGAGEELGVQYVLDGRIRRAGERIRVTVQLLDVREGASVWAGQFDETFTDVLSLEDDMSERVAEALIPRLSGDERQQLAKRGTDNPEAFEAYLRGRYHWNTFTVEGFAEALVCYQQAVALAPDYALAYAGIADYYNWLGIYAVLPFADTSAAAKEAALKAVALDDTLAEAYAALGFATMMHDFDWASCERYLRRAVELNPNYVTGRLWYAYFLGMSNRFDDALVQARRALELDPLTPIVPQTLCWLYYYSRRYEEALASTRQLVTREPRYGLTHIFLSMVLWRMGKREEGVATAEKAMGLLGRSPYTMAYLAAACAAAGRAEEARFLLEEIERERPARYVSPYLLSMVYSNLGEATRALGELERAVEIRDGRLVWLGVDPQFDHLRDDPRFVEILRRTRNPLAAGAAARVVARGETAPGARTAAPKPAAQTAADTHDRGEAQRLYTAGRYFAAKRTADGLRQAIERFEDAVEIDPQFAPAWAELADAYALLNWYVEPPPPDAFERGLAAARRAVEADDTLAEAHASLAFIKTHYQRDWAGADAEFRRAIELNPDSAISHRWYAFSLSAMGRHEEARAQAMRAQELSPRSAVMAMAVANVLFHARRYDEAIAQCHRALELDPGSVAAHVVMRWSYGMKGMAAEALAIYEKESAFAGDTPTTRAKYAHVLAAAGRADEARAILAELTDGRESNWVTPYELGIIYALVGDADAAFRWLERAREERAVGLTFIGVDPQLDALRPDPRFRELLRDIGIQPH